MFYTTLLHCWSAQKNQKVEQLIYILDLTTRISMIGYSYRKV